MHSLLITGRLLTRAIWNGIANVSTAADPNLQRKTEPQLVSAVCGFSKRRRIQRLIKGQFGDDAWFTAKYKSADVLGVADGVGGWRAYGIDPGEFSLHLMKTCERLVKLGRFNPTNPSELLAKSYYELLHHKKAILGSSTACVVLLNKENSTLYTANIGDSGFMVVRRGRVIHKSEEQQHPLACLGVINAVVIDVVKLRCNQSPFKACEERGCLGVVASSQNKFTLIELLKQKGIRNAYVFGYDDHYMLMVLHSNGALAPYDPYTNTSEYVLCGGKCPCPVYGEEKRCEENVANPCAPCEKPRYEECHPRYEKEECRPRYERKEKCHDVIINPCREKYIESCSSDSSSSSSSSEERCKIFPKKCKKACKSRSRCHRRCPTKIIELLTDIKTYTFDTRRYRRRGDVVVKVCSKDTKAKYERFVISKSGEIYTGNNKRCVPDSLPKCIKCPRELLKLKRYIEHKFCNRKVCLYINDKCDIYVLVDGKFYQVIKRDGRHRKPHFKRIRGRKLRHLIHHGLYGVEFGPIDCN